MTSTTTGFWVLVTLAEVSGLAALILVGVLGGKHVKDPGYGWDGSLHTFNYHPMLMSLGFIFLYGNGAIAFRVIATTGINLARTTQKLIHFIFQASALIVAIVALVAVFKYYDKQGYQDMFSPHSWIAIIATGLFTVQLIGGFFFFLFPKWGSSSLKASMLSLHVFTGKFIFIMMIATALMGLTEVVIYDIVKPEEFPSGLIVANMFGLCMLLFCGCIITILLKPQYQASSLAKDETIQMEIHDE
ncbi:cytochrome b561-like isoform X2 [Anneissia japonica]|uniref:cytochrome b561-like isoform X2 n=1 Tax=Anneissia japonica TaxID=1529436 RepID=UPI0014257FD0|nr:cytochrome b561-like isoform X2 [Anneissia japonica]